MILLAITGGLLACNSVDKKAGPVLSQEEKENAVKDTANFTTIEWLDSTVKDLGSVKDGQVVEVSYRFKNTGNKNLVISGVSASCGCTVPEKPEQPFAPGESGVIKAKFDSRGRPHGEARKSVFVTGNIKPEQQVQLDFKVVITD